MVCIAHAQVPTQLVDTTSTQLRSVQITAQLLAESPPCAAPARFTVVLEPFTTLFACPTGFWDHEEELCVSCAHVNADTCSPGTHIQGCDTLEHILAGDTSACTACPIATDTTEDWDPHGVCVHICKSNHFRNGDADTCTQCGTAKAVGECNPGL